MSPFGQSLSASDLMRQRELRAAKLRATALLGVTSAVFVALVTLGGTEGWIGFAVAAAEGSMVGGLADWFAVTALFRRPLGLPIPHTAIIAERKDRFASTLGEFVRETFLTPDVIGERVRAARVVERIASWLAEPAHAARVGSEGVDAFKALGIGLGRDEARRVALDLARTGAEAIPLAPLAGRLLRLLSENGRLDDLLDAALLGLDRYLDNQQELLRARLSASAPWWLPGPVEGRLFDGLLAVVHALLREAAVDRDHQLRREFELQVTRFVDRLEHSEAFRARGEQFKLELLANVEVQAWVADLVDDIVERVTREASDQSSSLRGLLADAIASGGRRVREDPVLQAAAEARLEGVVRHGARRFENELAELVTHTIARWDATETASRLELLLGPDLQFVRMSGTIIGAAAGLAIHALAQILS
jgi:uncharacterized membrane-anchored protein YjiN (DUF445 family)